MSISSDWPYRITIYNSDWYTICLWCEINIGKFDSDWYKLGSDPDEYIVNGSVRTTWYFKSEKDAMLFQLKWARFDNNTF